MNRHGRQKNGRYGSVREYVLDRAVLPRHFYNGFDLKKLAKACNISTGEVRAQLSSLGYEQKENKKGLKMWRLPYDKVQSLRE